MEQPSVNGYILKLPSINGDILELPSIIFERNILDMQPAVDEKIRQAVQGSCWTIVEGVWCKERSAKEAQVEQLVPTAENLSQDPHSDIHNIGNIL